MLVYKKGLGFFCGHKVFHGKPSRKKVLEEKRRQKDRLRKRS